MARHTIQIPIIKSSNDSMLLVGHYMSGLTEIPVPRISNQLYIGRGCRVGVAWDNSEIPTNKNIVSIDLMLYANGSLDVAIISRFTDFAEGSTIPSASPADKSYPRINNGWNTLPLTLPLKGNSMVIGDNYAGTDYFSYTDFNSHRASTNRPYLRVVYDDIPPDKPSSLYPSGITVSTRDVIRFAWLHNSKEGNQQKGFTLQYSTNGGSSWTTVSETTPNQFYDMPANTLPTSGTVLWRVRTIDGNEEISEYTTASFTLGIVPQKAPVPIAPISQYIDENSPVRFEWSFVGGSGGETQSKFDLQYSINGGSTWTTITRTTNETFHELPANAFSGGNVVWRVRTYNNWDEVSPYSENRSFTVIGSPAIPLISSVSNSGRPLITWQSTDQHIYELQILRGNEVIFDTGSIPSTSDRQFKLPIYLNDGNYIAKLRIYNEYNLSSPWAEKKITISTVKPQKPVIEVFNGEHSVTIKATGLSFRNLVYRDDILIGEVLDNTFIDFTGENKKEYKYFVRSIDSNDNFSDSDIKLGRCKFGGSTLALANNPADFINLKYGLNSNPTKSNQFGVVATLQNYDGREYPVTEYSEFSNRSKSLTFYLQTKEELNRFIKMIKQRKTFLFRNRDGDNIHGTILTINYDENETFWGYEINFSITQTGDAI